MIPQREYFDKSIANSDNTDGYYIIEQGDFVYNPRKSSDAPYGPVSIYKYPESGIVSPLYLCFRALKPINSSFYDYFFKSPSWHRYIYLSGDSGARHDRVSIKDDVFFSMPVYIPSEEEQLKVSSFLSLIEKRIADQQQLVEHLKKYKRGLLNRYFPLNSGNSNLIPLLGLIKEIMDGDWIESKDQSPRGIRLIQTGNVGVGEYIEKPESAKYISEETFERLHCTEIYSGDILVSRLPSPAGRACIVPNTNERMITAVDCTIIRCDETRCISEYLTQFLNSPSYFKTVESFLAGGTRQRISRKNLESILVPMVEMEEQKQIADILTQFDKKILHEISYLQGLQQCKKGLLQALFV